MITNEAERREHWEKVYEGRGPTERSWFEAAPEESLAMLAAAGLPSGARVVDVGGGTANLAEALLDRGYRPTVLDISEAALDEARLRLGARALAVEWVRADVTALPALGPFDLWHDRAVFHFLTEAKDRRRYVELLERAVIAGGAVVIATFAEDGPVRCSGLSTMRYDADELQRELGPSFALVETRAVEHRTPAAGIQRFRYNRLRRLGWE